MEFVLPEKVDVFKKLMKTTGNTYVHLDPRCVGVTVPNRLKRQPKLVLWFSTTAAIKIPDLEVTDSWLSGTLLFAGSPFKGRIPWHAVFAMVGETGRGMVWPESMPSEVVAEVECETLKRRSVEGPKRDLRQPKPKRSHLRLVT